MGLWDGSWGGHDGTGGAAKVRRHVRKVDACAGPLCGGAASCWLADACAAFDSRPGAPPPNPCWHEGPTQPPQPKPQLQRRQRLRAALREAALLPISAAGGAPLAPDAGSHVLAGGCQSTRGALGAPWRSV